jgi:hypothetical protein
MFHWVSLNCRAMSIWWWWAPLNSPNTTPHTHNWTFNLKSKKKWLILNNPTGFTNINIWANEATWRCINFWSREIHTIMFVWIALWPQGYVNLSFCGSKNFLTLQMRYPISEGGWTSVFTDGIGHLRQVTELAYLPQSQFIPTRTLSTPSTIQVHHVRCILSEHLSIIIKSHNEKALGTFPILV